MQTKESTPTQEGADQKSHGRIVALEDGRKKAIVPRNSYRWLKAVTSQDPIEWEGQKSDAMKQGAVYEVGLTIPSKAFPGMDSAKTLAQSVKSSLASAETKSGTPVEPIIEILRSGNPVQRTIIRLNVDEFEQTSGMQGVKSLGTARKGARKTAGARKKTAAGRNGGRKAQAGRGRTGSKRTTQAPEATAQRGTTRRQVSIESFLNALKLKNYGEFKAAEREVETLQQNCPIIFSHLVKGVAA